MKKLIFTFILLLSLILTVYSQMTGGGGFKQDQESTVGRYAGALGKETTAKSFGLATGLESEAGLYGVALGYRARGEEGSFVFSDFSSTQVFDRATFTNWFSVRAKHVFFKTPEFEITGKIVAPTGHIGILHSTNIFTTDIMAETGNFTNIHATTGHFETVNTTNLLIDGENFADYLTLDATGYDPTKFTIGGIKIGTYLHEKPYEEIFLRMFYSIIPTIELPTGTLTFSGDGNTINHNSYMELGSTINNLNITFSFTRGTVNPIFNEDGELMNERFTGILPTNSLYGATSNIILQSHGIHWYNNKSFDYFISGSEASNITSVATNITQYIIQKTNRVTYTYTLFGKYVYDNFGIPLQYPYHLNLISTSSGIGFYGVLPILATSDNADTPLQDSKYKYVQHNKSTIVITLAGNSPGNNPKFAIPVAVAGVNPGWNNTNLFKVELWNADANVFQEIPKEFSAEHTTYDINNNYQNANYRTFTYTGPITGQRIYKFTFNN